MFDKRQLTSSNKVFADLTVFELYAILQLRSEIFVLEQKCLYQDMDDLDSKAHHFMMFNKNNSLLAYARIFSKGVTYPEVSIGRIITKEHGKGLGNILMKAVITETLSLFGEVPIRIGAQCYAIAFYEKFNFTAEGDEYDEDGIPHIEMVRV